ncbi:hypothetical protein ABE28_015195 [Peribacillus muralis]|uniref:Uncharacterized protein n=1 Tax=Peribacillus muralis TaxID=264697 RepID=A0A1B3XR53_9BACI|nr:hypothetical protein [Peribacillus muralis]AOH55705.1 hypothetical protein ABE28_015195 [Peribacillus muralis]
MKLQLKYTVLLVITTIFVILYFSNNQAEETITYFPIDSSLHFEHASTLLTPKENGGSAYSITWRVTSALDRPAYLRQDVSLLYTNGKLTGALKNWRQNKQELSQKAKAKESESGRYDAVTFHYAEVHPSETIFTSAQQLSKDKIYAITTPSFQYFHRPISEEQIEWKKTLDSLTNQTVQDGLEKASHAYQINLEQYNIIPLTDLPDKKNQWLSAFPSFKREEIVGKLWEGLYKDYVLGVKKEDGSTVNAQGSTIPLLLIAQNQRELLVLFTLRDGTPIMLRQEL